MASTKPARRSGMTRAESHFEEFYRANVRAAVGERLAAAELRAAYSAWAHEAGCDGLSFKLLKRFMAARGHTPFHSDGSRYADAELLTTEEADGLAQSRAAIGAVRNARALARLDAIMGELSVLRRSLAASPP